MVAKKNLFVILTVPHAKCNSHETCDIISSRIAKRISASFKRFNISHRVIMGDVLRRIYDLNRKTAQNTEFHRKLNQLITVKKKANKDLVLLDIHSGSFGLKKMVILVQARFRDKNLLEILAKRMKATVTGGGVANFITEKGLRRGIPSLLLEFNDNLKYTTSYIDGISKSILEYQRSK